VKGCLSFLVFAALLIAAFTWFALPPVAGLAVEMLIPRDAIAGNVSVRVETDFPPELYTLHADAVVLTGTDALIADGLLDADRAAITLTDVNVLERTAARLDGRLDGVHVNQGPITLLTIRRIDVSGPLDAVVATARLDGKELRTRAGAAIESAIGTPPQSLALAAPDRVSAKIQGVTIAGRLVVRGGALLVEGDAPLPTVELIPASATGPLSLRSIEIDGGTW
jgi:hypothetical protein